MRGQEKIMGDSTSIETKAKILSDFYLEFKSDPEYEDFFSFNDPGLPIAYAISSGIVGSTEVAEGFINETFELLIDLFGITEDTGFETLDDILPTSQ
jgi:hypothetical protein